MDERGVITAPGPFEGLDRFEARPARRRGAARGGPDRRRDPAVRARGRSLLPLRHHRGAAAVAAVVRPASRRWPRRPATPCATAGCGSTPAEMDARYFGWVDDMHDWCISRQLWWGHRIPVWYSAGRRGALRRPGRGCRRATGWTQDPDVLDTWFSSALWPFSTLGWPDDTPDLRAFYPTSVLVTGYDILFFWVARMMMFGLYAMAAPDRRRGAVPQVALHGLVRDQSARRCPSRAATPSTRSTGSTGSAPTRPGSPWPAAPAPAATWRSARNGSAGARNFCNKLWNATRFALHERRRRAGALPRRERAWLSVADRWILSRLPAVIAEVDALYEEYEFAKACEALYHFAWDEFCDWYLELAKVPLPLGADERRPRLTRARARLRARPAAAAAPPGHAVRHRGAVDRADRRRVGGGGAVAGGGRRTPTRRPRRARVADAAGDRGPQVPR